MRSRPPGPWIQSWGACAWQWLKSACRPGHHQRRQWSKAPNIGAAKHTSSNVWLTACRARKAGTTRMRPALVARLRDRDVRGLHPLRSTVAQILGMTNDHRDARLNCACMASRHSTSSRYRPSLHWHCPAFPSSTCAVYRIPDKLPIEEPEATRPIGVYGRTKLVAENFLRNVATTGTIRTVMLRYFDAAVADT
jgi:NAD dependent epimerase/dehydratase family